MRIEKAEGSPSFEREIGQAVAELLALERKREARRNRQFRTVEGWLLSLALLYLGEWFLMILVGVVHSEWIPALSTISYGTAAVVFNLIYLICAIVRALPDARGRS